MTCDLFIKTKKPLEIGRDCELHVSVPGYDDPLKIKGSVVWSSKGAEVMVGQEEGMGIRYDPADTAASMLHEYTGAPSRMTVQLPHSARLQPIFVPVNRNSSRRNSARVIRDSISA